MSNLQTYEGICEVLSIPSSFDKLLAVEGVGALIDKQVLQPRNIVDDQVKSFILIFFTQAES